MIFNTLVSYYLFFYYSYFFDFETSQAFGPIYFEHF